MSNMKELDTFTTAYIETALWSSNDGSMAEGGTPMDHDYTINDIAPETLAQMIEDCRKFQEAHYELITREGSCLRCGPDYDEIGHAGHDFWLTRNGHGAGFWDGAWSDEADAILTPAAKSFGEFDLYVGDDNLIHGS